MTYPLKYSHLPVGHSVIPRDIACCEITVNLPPVPVTNGSEDNHQTSTFVVDDLTKHPDLRDRPYVTDFPNGRYYAGAPITTPSGTNIGAYCILDDKPRDGISEKDALFLRDMSRTVMQHLETVRALSERQHNNHMVAGLGKFVRGLSAADGEATLATTMPLNHRDLDGAEYLEVHSSIPNSLVDEMISPAAGSLSETSHHDQALNNGTTTVPQDDPSGFPLIPEHVSSKVYGSLSTDVPEISRNSQEDKTLDIQADPLRTPRTLTDVQKSRPPRPPLIKRDSASLGKNAYQRAAEILCQSLRVDGVAFLDASVSTFGGLVESTEGGSSSDSDDTTIQTDSMLDGASANDARPCKVLGCAQTVQNDPGYPAGTRPHKPAKKLTETFIRNLMRRNPKGRIWTYNEAFVPYSEDGLSTDQDSADSASRVEPPSPKSTKKRAPTQKQRRSDAEMLQRAFPGARCIVLQGFRDNVRRRWSTGALYWTYDAHRVLSVEIEMRFVSAFCDVVAAENKRLEAIGADKAKSDFVSSVSHELRSPLHGILGSVEVLLERELDDVTATLVDQINSCGQTLLHIIDHLLDFAMLKNQHLKKGDVRSSRIGTRFLPATETGKDGLTATNMDVALDDLTEDVVLSSAYSFYYKNDLEEPNRTTVILDIERSSHATWRCQLATGAWKRICINLVTNALKYTPVGYVKVSLKQKSRPGQRRRFDAVLTVADSGKGISEDFQRNHLFKDFTQEDTLSSGLGIGMHMVLRMVNAMGGRIDVHSDKKGSGTRVTVTVPLERQQISAEALLEDSPALRSLEGLKVGIITGTRPLLKTRDDSLLATASAMGMASVEKTLKFLGARSEPYVSEHSNSYDLNVVLDSDLDSHLQSVHEVTDRNRHSNIAPMLVLCRNTPAAQASRALWDKIRPSPGIAVNFIALPCGVKQAKRAVDTVLLMHQEMIASSTLGLQDLRLSGDTLPKHLDGSERDTTNSQLLVSQASLSASLVYDVDKTPTAELTVSLSDSTDVLIPSEPLTTTGTSPTEESKGTTTPTPPPPPTRPSQALPPPSLPPSAASSPLPTPTLLLVDDNAINLQLLIAFAKKYKYPYISAVDGALAVEAFTSAHKSSLSVPSPPPTLTASSTAIPSIILMDINMPVMDGYEAAQRIRAYERKHAMRPARIIAVTALQSEAAHKEAFGSGFDLFLSKPLKFRDLLGVIEER